MTRAGKMSVNVHGLILSYRQIKVKNVEFQVFAKKFIKPSSSDPNAPNSN